ncbi:unnamed protein product [Brassicogethes aeneus]|uniref:Uncharacterized protein n=1 Tax=Brassicogethes aeneus TaxID=1431903 RepID=A0A9P0FL24_BRAAE|nr:unnamed protein product [Brassicogethes aeneus]
MFKSIVLLSVVACSLAAVLPDGENVHVNVPIVSVENVVEPDGAFHFNYESADGTKVHEEGTIKAGSKPEEVVESVQGGYEFMSPEGKKILVQYIADENGFQPQSDILPVAPPIPEAIARSIKYNMEHPQKDDAYVVQKKVVA